MNAPYSLCIRSLLCSAVLLTLAACGGSGSDEKQTTTPPVTETPQNQAPQISGQSQTLRVGDEQMQEATAGDMIHSLWELVEYGSSIVTLYPGDVINNGTSGGTGVGTAVRGEQRFLQPGEEIVATIDGIGTLAMPVVSEESPTGGTGARLPPVSSYRR